MNFLQLSKHSIGSRWRRQLPLLSHSKRFNCIDLKSAMADDDQHVNEETNEVPIIPGNKYFLAAKLFHPNVMRVYYESKELRETPTFFKDVQKSTERTLNIMNRYVTKMPVERLKLIHNLQPQIISANKIDATFVPFLKTGTNAQLKGLVSFMIINQTRSPHVWAALDRKFTFSHEAYDIDFQLLVAYGILNCKAHFESPPKFPQLLLKRLMDDKDSLKNLPFTEESEVFDSVSSTVAHDNLAVERLSLLLNVVALQSKFVVVARQSNPIFLETLSAYTLKVLTAIQNPVKLMPLKYVWENLSTLSLPNAYLIYRKLHQQISFSIATDTAQVVFCDDCIASLFSTMVTSKYKSSALIEKIFEIIHAHGFNYDYKGMAIFNALIQLQAYTYGISVLKSMLASTTLKLDYLFKQWRRNHNLLSDETRDYINAWLLKEMSADVSTQKDAKGDIIPSFRQSAIPEPSSADMIFALFSFGRDLPSTTYGRTLKKIEANFMKKLSSLSAGELCTIVQAYALVGRYNPNVIAIIDEKLGEYIAEWRLVEKPCAKAAASNKKDNDAAIEIDEPQELSPLPRLLQLVQIETIFWSFARINHQSVHLNDLKEYYVSLFNQKNQTGRHGTSGISRLLWSLAVLEKLDLGIYSVLAPTLYRGQFNQKGEDAMTTQQIIQIRSEFECQIIQCSNQLELLENNNTQSSPDRKPSVDTTQLKETLGRLQNASNELTAFVERLENLNRSKSSNQPIYSSFSHLDASKSLFKLGVVHENEKLLPNGYLIDVFIPKYTKNYDEVIENIVLEFDGPTHFESYASKPLGPTVMKKRHLQQMGYKFVTMRHSEYSVSASKEEKCRVIREALDKLKP